jgi:hypothetical protein
MARKVRLSCRIGKSRSCLGVSTAVSASEIAPSLSRAPSFYADPFFNTDEVASNYVSSGRRDVGAVGMRNFAMCIWRALAIPAEKRNGLAGLGIAGTGSVA